MIETKQKFVKSMTTIFNAAFPTLSARLNVLFGPLFDANYECCRANNAILELRRGGGDIADQVAAHEWTARSVGEKRVGIKADINTIIAEAFPKHHYGYWSDDDLVCSIGDLVDRISIENIKQTFFANTAEEKRQKSVVWCDRVLIYLMNKLESVRTNGYECVQEVRTYVLE